VTWNELPWKFEAGTPNVCGAIALSGATDRRSGLHLIGAVDYLEQLGMGTVLAHEAALADRMLRGLNSMPEIVVYGPPDVEHRCGLVAFGVEKGGEAVDCHLIAQMLDDVGIAVRAGGHCAYPLARQLGITGTVRASFHVYNTTAEVDRFLCALQEIVREKLL
jgi:cysteine desulfurase/selenocysteine lyase